MGSIRRNSALLVTLLLGSCALSSERETEASLDRFCRPGFATMRGLLYASLSDAPGECVEIRTDYVSGALVITGARLYRRPCRDAGWTPGGDYAGEATDVTVDVEGTLELAEPITGETPMDIAISIIIREPAADRRYALTASQVPPYEGMCSAVSRP